LSDKGWTGSEKLKLENAIYLMKNINSVEG